MVCIVCHGEECEFSFKCQLKHEATCFGCLKVYLAMNVHKIFQTVHFHCPYCYENVSQVKTDREGILVVKSLCIDDFGIKQNDFPTHTKIVVPKSEIRKRIHNAIAQYAFDIIKGIALSHPRVISETELFNTFEFFCGLRNMLSSVQRYLRTPFFIEQLKPSDKSMIETSIIIITNELNAFDATWGALEAITEATAAAGTDEVVEVEEETPRPDDNTVLEDGEVPVTETLILQPRSRKRSLYDLYHE